MKSAILFVAVSLILVTGIVAIAHPNTVQAGDKPKSRVVYCLKGHESDPNDSAFCQPTRTQCKDLFVPVGEKGGCVRVLV